MIGLITPGGGLTANGEMVIVSVRLLHILEMVPLPVPVTVYVIGPVLTVAFTCGPVVTSRKDGGDQLHV